MIRLLAIGIAVFISTQTAIATEIISAKQAAKRASDQSVYLIDIRTPDEWKESGVATKAHAITMHDRYFLQNLTRLTKGKKDAPIALICATGGRSAWLAEQLESRGYTNISDVSEGMMGSRAGPGWLKSGLPVKATK